MGIRAGELSRPTKSTDGNIDQMGDIFLQAFGEYNQLILRDLFKNLMETTPEKTGTLRYNWRFLPGGNAGKFLAVNDGTSKPWPREPDEKNYLRNFKQYTIYNNSPYIVKVNNGEGGNEANQNFIQRAMEMTNQKF